MSFDADPFYKPSKIRIIVLCATSALIALVYLAKLFSMQVIQISLYETIAEAGSRRSETIPTKRGEIYDRSYDTPIATSYNSYNIRLIPDNANPQAIADVIDKLAVIFGIEEQQLFKKIPKDFKFYKPIVLISDVSYEKIVYIAEHIDEFPSIEWEGKPKRYYPLGAEMAHVLGYVGEITPEELQVMYNQGYSSTSIIGKNGIEKVYDSLLRGQDGIRFKRVDARGQGVSSAETTEVPPQLGDVLVLSLDRKIQNLALKALGKRMGAIIVMKPATAEILAMVSYPSYDPNLFYGNESSVEFSRLLSDSRSPFLNRAIQAAASPASTFKILMTIADLQEKAIPLSQKINCPGWVQIGNRRFNCHERKGHGHEDIFDAMADSCNVFYYTLGNEYLGVNTITQYAESLGFGQLSGIDLPGEITGLLPTPEWKKSVRGSVWVGGDTVNLSIGQGDLTATPLQLANLVAAVVNGGTIYQPHVVNEIRDPVTFSLKEQITPKILYQVDYRPDVWENTRLAMRGVITDGTARDVVYTKAVQIAAKTGTAQTGAEESKHSWFASYAPYNFSNPEEVISVTIWVDAINGWEWWAPKAANIIYHGIFNQMSYEQTLLDLHPWYAELADEMKLLREGAPHDQ